MRKRLLLSLFALVITLLAISVSLVSAPPTTLPLTSLRPGGFTGLLVWSVKKGWHLAVLDAATVVLDETGPQSVIRAVVPAPVVVHPAEKVVYGYRTTSQAVWNLPDSNYAPDSFQVWRNGLLQAVLDDYSVSGTVVTFFPDTAPGPGDIVQFRYRLVPLPATAM